MTSATKVNNTLINHKIIILMHAIIVVCVIIGTIDVPMLSSFYITI